MLKAILWTILVLTALIAALGFAAARKSAGLAAPTVREGALPPCSNKPNCVSSEVNPEHAAYVEPINAEITIRQLQTLIESLGGQITSTDDTHLHAEFRTRLFGFTDDMLVVFDEPGNLFRIRSSSRVGHSDLGANRKRVEALRQRINNR